MRGSGRFIVIIIFFFFSHVVEWVLKMRVRRGRRDSRALAPALRLWNAPACSSRLKDEKKNCLLFVRQLPPPLTLLATFFVGGPPPPFFSFSISIRSQAGVSQAIIESVAAHDGSAVVNVDLVVAVVEYVVHRQPPGAILVFLPGWEDISKVNQQLLSNPHMRDPDRCLIIPLHSMMPTVNQRTVFERPPAGVTKVCVLATFFK